MDIAEDHVSRTDLTSAAEMLERLSASPPDKTPPAKSSKTRRAYRKPVIVDFNLLKAVAERIGINAKNRNSEELLNQVLEIFLALGMDAVDAVSPTDSQPVESDKESFQQAVLESPPAAEVPDAASDAIAPGSDFQIIAHQAKTLSWLTQEIETLRSRVQQLEQELGQAQAQPTAQHTSLKQENERLKQERDAAVEKLEVFRMLLNSNGTHSTPPPEAAPSPAPARLQTATKPAPEKVMPVAVSEKPAPVPVPPAAPAEDADLDPGVLRALYAIIDHNNAQADHADKWAISFPVMKDLCKQIGVATQTKINRVFQAKAALIERHHRKHELGQRHNRVHQGQNITEVISLSE
ncbi:MAG: hypothetical protein D6742_16730 [Cyanobacteria bacterium J069]|nr:MAG: hypothetical protein D6742_16730 [Cyanobacteria bacterium J069]